MPKWRFLFCTLQMSFDRVSRAAFARGYAVLASNRLTLLHQAAKTQLHPTSAVRHTCEALNCAARTTYLTTECAPCAAATRLKKDRAAFIAMCGRDVAQAKAAVAAIRHRSSPGNPRRRRVGHGFITQPVQKLWSRRMGSPIESVRRVLDLFQIPHTVAAAQLVAEGNGGLGGRFRPSCLNSCAFHNPGIDNNKQTTTTNTNSTLASTPTNSVRKYHQ